MTEKKANAKKTDWASILSKIGQDKDGEVHEHPMGLAKIKHEESSLAKEADAIFSDHHTAHNAGELHQERQREIKRAEREREREFIQNDTPENSPLLKCSSESCRM